MARTVISSPITTPCLCTSVGIRCLCPGDLTLTFPLTHGPQILQREPWKQQPLQGTMALLHTTCPYGRPLSRLNPSSWVGQLLESFPRQSVSERDGALLRRDGVTGSCPGNQRRMSWFCICCRFRDSDTKTEKADFPQLQENKTPANPFEPTVWLNYLGRPWLAVRVLLSCLESVNYSK